MTTTSTCSCALYVCTRALRALVCVLGVLLPSLVSAQSLPSGWAAADVGTPAVQGGATFAGGQFTVRGAGTDIWGRADQFTFVYRQLAGDGDIVARVASLDDTHNWAKAGVMIRASLAAGSAHGMALISAENGAAFQRRRTTGGNSSHVAGGSGAAPVWLKLERRGTAIRAYRSANGSSWTAIGTDVISMPQTVLVGLAVTSHNANVAAQSVFTNVVVTPVTTVPPGPLPSGWTSGDIGNPQAAGSAGYNAGTYTVRGAGQDIGGQNDQFRYVYRRVDGDTDIIARVVAVENVDAGSKAGVMIRDALTPNAAHFSMFVSAGNGVAFQRRAAAGGNSASTTTGTSLAPFWVRVQRRGNAITAFQSANGTTWTQVGTGTLALPSVYVGLAATSRNASQAATALLDNVVVQTPAANQPPAVSLTSPAANATFLPPASVGIAATASDVDGTVARVDFFSGTTLIGTDTTSPFGFTWAGVGVGTYTLKAVATDDDGATTESATRTIRVQTAANQPPTVSLTAPANGATFPAPATITVSATASDTDGTIAGVDFFFGTTLIGTDASNPYSVTWSNVGAGGYSLTAVARDNGGAVTTSAARAITVTGGGGLPTGWTSADVGSPQVAGSAQHQAGRFSVRGGGADIWDPSDQFHYVHRQVTGDVDLVSRVVSVERADAFTKAGVMIRQSLAANAAHASVFVTPGNDISFQRRPSTGAASQYTAAGTNLAPYWVRLQRRGSTITAATSPNGTTWTTAGTMTLTTATVYVGLAVTAHNSTAAATAVFESVVAGPPTSGNQPPAVSLTAPANGATFTPPATITVTATASDTDGTIAAVDFFAGTTLIGSDTSNPYSVTWNNVTAGNYSLTAVARDNGGATTTSAARSISVTTVAPRPYRAVFVPSTNHSTAVDRYILRIYTSGANPDTATPVATLDLGKPPIANGECNVDIAPTVLGLAAGNYIATVTATGPGGSARSAPSAAFTR